MIEKIGNREHPNAEILRAIADGKQVQWRPAGGNNTWIDWMETANSVSPLVRSLYYEWRVKPEGVRYRLALLDGLHTKTDTTWIQRSYISVAETDEQARNTEKLNNFVRWLGPWREVEL